MNSVEALDYALGVLDRSRCVGPCWEHDGCRRACDGSVHGMQQDGSDVQESGWTYLSEEFIEDLERAIGQGQTISSVLSAYGINRGTYYSWLSIGEGRMLHWRDGTPVSQDMRTNARRLYKRVLRAREATLRAKRQALR